VAHAPLIDVSGSPRIRGESYGEAARDRIRLGLDHYGAQIARHGLDRATLAALSEDFIPRIADFDADYVLEMEGIAAGAAVPLADIVLLNARTEILQLAERQATGKVLLPEADPDGCTGAIVLPEASADGRLIHAQNWDWKAECAETAVVLRITGTDDPDILCFAEAGQLARCGLNASGIGITANYLECERDYRTLGVPLALLRRKVLQQHYLAPALRVAYCTPKSAANNIMISQAGGFGIDLECAPDETFPVQADDGLIVHANHWQSPVALSKLRDTGIASTPDSLYRDLRVKRHLERHRGRITTDSMKNALFDDYQTPHSVCRPPRPGSSGNLSATVAMIVMTPEQGLMEVAMLPALNRDFTTFTLAGPSGDTDKKDKQHNRREHA
jgi:isopenicillin-N N-acyltransferase like protein